MGLAILVQVILLFYYGRSQIQNGRTKPTQQLTLVSLIMSAICGLVEVLQGLQTLSACLHHADVNELGVDNLEYKNYKVHTLY